MSIINDDFNEAMFSDDSLTTIAILNGSKQFICIYDGPGSAVSVGGMQYESNKITLNTLQKYVGEVKHGDSVQVGAVTYIIAEILNDGTGFLTIELSLTSEQNII